MKNVDKLNPEISLKKIVKNEQLVFAAFKYAWAFMRLIYYCTFFSP